MFKEWANLSKKEQILTNLQSLSKSFWEHLASKLQKKLKKSSNALLRSPAKKDHFTKGEFGVAIIADQSVQGSYLDTVTTLWCFYVTIRFFRETQRFKPHVEIYLPHASICFMISKGKSGIVLRLPFLISSLHVAFIFIPSLNCKKSHSYCLHQQTQEN